MKILLHICCSSCALYPVKIIREEGHDFTGFWFNPNIQPYEEYELRLNSLKALADRWRIDMIYNTEETIQNPPLPPFAKGGNSGSPTLEKGDIGGFLDENHKLKVENFQISKRPERCTSCYKMRLEKTAEEAQRQGFDAFSTTLLISPYQDFEQIISIGSELAEKHNVIFYFRDFRQYFREAMAYAKEMGLYRQKYCGCIYSREERFAQIQK
ncbi:MAG TPA: epoxyqueuosine reductase QueH [Thermodesulfovibrionia bacterium]|nr:epoxyqueuosine reductase QueH [Thermodesulfovibrionia bacterium]